MQTPFDTAPTYENSTARTIRLVMKSGYIRALDDMAPLREAAELAAVQAHVGVCAANRQDNSNAPCSCFVGVARTAIQKATGGTPAEAVIAHPSRAEVREAKRRGVS